MTQEDSFKILKENLLILNDALNWLKRSYKLCLEFGIKESYTDEEFDTLETLASRFARVSDIAFQKLFRSIDKVELEDKGTYLDALNRAQKRNLIASIDEVREIKDLRNQIIHEYVKNELQDVYLDILDFVPKLMDICDKIFDYCSKYR